MQTSWPPDRGSLAHLQDALARAQPPRWFPSPPMAVGGVYACYPRGEGLSAEGSEQGWAAAAVVQGGLVVATSCTTGAISAPYEAGLLALREGPLLAAAVSALSIRPDVLLVNATGRDHPRRAGLALHLGAVLELPTVGVTDRPLLATGQRSARTYGAMSVINIQGEVVGCWLTTRLGARPVVVHPAWRTDLATAVEVVLSVAGTTRTPLPLRAAREVARKARSSAQSR